MTQARPPEDSSRSVWIEGSATFTIVESRTIIRNPTQRTTSANQRLSGCTANRSVIDRTVANDPEVDDLVQDERFRRTDVSHTAGFARRPAISPCKAETNASRCSSG